MSGEGEGCRAIGGILVGIGLVLALLWIFGVIVGCGDG